MKAGGSTELILFVATHNKVGKRYSLNFIKIFHRLINSFGIKSARGTKNIIRYEVFKIFVRFQSFFISAKFYFHWCLIYILH